jgi:pantetheine-phosphate adenylyltransferase
MGHLNAQLAPELETVFLMSSPHYSFVSSSGVREIAAFGGDVSGYVTPSVAEALKARYS